MNTLDHSARILFKNNYRFIQATAEDIARFLQKGRFVQDPQPDFFQILASLNAGGWAAKLWTEITREFVPPFASIGEYHNLVPAGIRNSLATLVSGTSVTPTFKANYFALGTGSTAPASSDTQLQTETLRAAFTQRQAVLNVAYLDVFFGTTQVAGNSYLEAGIFIDGSASANTGYLLSHVAISQSLGSNQTLTVNCTITIS